MEILIPNLLSKSVQINIKKVPDKDGVSGGEIVNRGSTDCVHVAL